MDDKLKLYFHVFVLLTYMSGVLWQLANLKDENPDHWFIADVMKYKERYFTFWNAIIHTVYFSLALSEDIDASKDHKIGRFATGHSITQLKAYIFFTLLIPCTAFVCGVFWFFYFYDRELVYPKSAEYFAMKYSNHVFHTFVGVFALLEYLFNGHHPEISFTSCFIGVTAVHIFYYSIFFYHYFTMGRFPYPLFHGITWFQVWGLIITLYSWTLFAAKMGIEIHKYMGIAEPENMVLGKDVKC